MDLERYHHGLEDFLNHIPLVLHVFSKGDKLIHNQRCLQALLQVAYVHHQFNIL